MPARCDRCRFFHPHPPASAPEVIVFSADGFLGGGECRHRPPTWRELELACFPIVASNGWCGEFVPRESAPRSVPARPYAPVAIADHGASMGVGGPRGERKGLDERAGKT